MINWIKSFFATLWGWLLIFIMGSLLLSGSVVRICKVLTDELNIIFNELFCFIPEEIRGYVLGGVILLGVGSFVYYLHIDTKLKRRKANRR